MKNFLSSSWVNSCIHCILFLGLSVLNTPNIYAQSDSLPFKIGSEKLINAQKLASKREGWYLTGLPRFAYDPIQGFGFGVDGEIFNNRDKSDPFFAYTPYRERYKLSLWVSQNGKIGADVHTDMPYFLDSRWRIRSRFAFAFNPNKLYFGYGETALDPLSYTDRQTGVFVDNAMYSDYAENLLFLRPGITSQGEDPDQMYTDRRFNFIHYTKYALDLIGERSYFQGRLRLVAAVGFTYLDYMHYDGQQVSGARDANGNTVDATNGQTKITQDYEAAQSGDPDAYWNRYNITGYDGGLSIKMKAGIIYDTRDFEPDPYKGTLLEYSLGYSDHWMGSDFSYTRHLVQWMQFVPLFEKGVYQSSFAFRNIVSYIGGSAVFFREILDIWSATQGRVGILGGEDSMRGYKKFRFGAPIYGFGSVEWRTQFAEFKWLDQNWKLSGVPFVDYGRVWDEFSNMKFEGFMYSPGMGMRIHWNQNTILRLDYSWSKEDRQFFLVFGQMF